MEIIEKTVTPNYIMIRINVKEFNDMDLVDRWCNETCCGKRVNLYSFSFKTEAEFMMFTLKWVPKMSKTR